MKALAKKLFREGTLLSKLYYIFPGKTQLFLLLRKLSIVPENLQWYLRFKGAFKVKLFTGDYFKMYHPGFYFENNLFWKKLDQCWEKESLLIWQKISQNSEVILDVGANSGTYSLIAKAINPNALVFAFEPLPRMYKLIEKNNKLNKFDVKILPVAVSNEVGQATFYDIESINGDVSSASLSKTFLENENQIPIEVEVIKLSSFIKQQNLKKIDLMKVDVESFEPQVLEGFIPYLDKFRPSMIIEILDDKSGKEIEALVNGMNYLFFDIDENKGLTQKNNLTKSSTYNYLICQPEVAKSINLI